MVLTEVQYSSLLHAHMRNKDDRVSLISRVLLLSVLLWGTVTSSQGITVFLRKLGQGWDVLRYIQPRALTNSGADWFHLSLFASGTPPRGGLTSELVVKQEFETTVDYLLDTLI